MDFPGSAGDRRTLAIYRHRRRVSAATVELAAAAALRLAADYLLASPWNSGAVPDPLRRTWRPRFRPAPVRPVAEEHYETVCDGGNRVWTGNRRGAGRRQEKDKGGRDPDTAGAQGSAWLRGGRDTAPHLPRDAAVGQGAALDPGARCSQSA